METLGTDGLLLFLEKQVNVLEILAGLVSGGVDWVVVSKLPNRTD